MLEIKNICFSREGKDILKNVSLTFPDNKVIVITGANGSGKSTLAKIIMGIEKPDSGSIIFNGQDITDMPIDKRANLGLGFAFQQPVKFKGITVRDILNITAKRKLEKCELCRYLSDVGLCANDYLDRELDSNLSGGELKRIEIAMLALKNSTFTLFDEPEAGIDLWSFNSLIDIFENMKNDTKNTIVIISHQERILDIADEIIILSNGTIKEMGKRNKILPKLLLSSKSNRYSKEVKCNE
ncbi:MAG: ATP-binding cassette domain-containing protein [Clostridia bacterium]|nr:ATP-binding cassette domain-containing protein [Clostridia bacterium]